MGMKSKKMDENYYNEHSYSAKKGNLNEGGEPEKEEILEQNDAIDHSARKDNMHESGSSRSPSMKNEKMDENDSNDNSKKMANINENVEFESVKEEKMEENDAIDHS